MKKPPSGLWISSIIVTLCFAACVKSAAPNTPSNKQDSTSTPPDTTKTVSPPKTWVVSTIAGSGARGFADGDSTNSEFNNPQFVAIDLQGNVLVSDVANQRIRMISPANKVTTWTDDSIANLSLTSNTNPVFGNIFGLCVDSKNDVFAIDYNWIRKFTSPANSSVFAGQLLVGYKDSSIGTDADFQFLMHMTIDRQDNIFVTDYDMSNVFHVRKITPAGSVSTVQMQDNTGVNSNSSGSLWFDYGVAVDSADNIYVGSNTVIKKISPQGTVSIFAGGGSGYSPDGQGTAARFGGISDLTCDAAGNLWVVDGLYSSIRKVTPDGTVTTIAGNLGQGFADGPGATAQFLYPMGIAVARNGTIYVVDAGNNRIRKITQQ
jgi:hypothetical protein